MVVYNCDIGYSKRHRLEEPANEEVIRAVTIGGSLQLRHVPGPRADAAAAHSPDIAGIDQAMRQFRDTDETLRSSVELLDRHRTGEFRPAAALTLWVIPMGNPSYSCGLTRVRHRAAAELVRSVSVKLQAALGYDEPCMIMAMLDTSKQPRVE